MSLVHLLRKLTVDRVAESNRSPMLKRINHIATMRTDDTILCLACGVIFATLTISFLI